jgi:hypothetical protein
MYHKVKNTLAGLGMVVAFVTGGLFFSEPVPAENVRPMGPTVSSDHQEAALALALVKAAVVIAQAELAEEMAESDATVEAIEAAIEPAAAATRRGSQLRMQVGMPYYSFGALLPRRRES